MNYYDPDAVHLVLDIETLGTKPGCVVTEIGMCIIKDCKVINSAHYYISPLDSIFFLGLTADKATVDWWTQFEDEYKANLISKFKTAMSPELVVDGMLQFLNYYKINFFWGNSPDFDYKILDEFINRVNEKYGFKYEAPWNKFWMLRDVRTLIRNTGLMSTEIKNNQVHDSLSDAKWEAEQLCYAFDCMKQMNNLINLPTVDVATE